MERETNLPCRRISNDLCKYFALKEVQHNNSPLRKCGLYIVTSSQRAQYRKRRGREYFCSGAEPDKRLSQAVKANFTAIRRLDSRCSDRM